MRRWSRCTDAAKSARRCLSTSGVELLPGGFDMVTVINLPNREARMASMEKQLAAAGFDVSRHVRRFEAVVGSRLDPQILQRRGLISRLALRRLARPEQERIWGMDLNSGGLGCGMSHALLWAEIAARRLERVLVLEDDCLIPRTFLTDFCEAWKRVEDHPSVRDSWGLVYVSGLDTAGRGAALEIAPGLRMVHALHRTTNAYVVNAAGARALLSACLPLTFQLDTEMTTQLSVELPNGEAAVVGVPCFSLHPSLIVQATRFGSDIQSDNAQRDLAAEEEGRCAAAGWPTVPPEL